MLIVFIIVLLRKNFVYDGAQTNHFEIIIIEAKQCDTLELRCILKFMD
jgi:hypothetical protein